MDERKQIRDAVNIDNTTFVSFEFLKCNIKVDEMKRKWSKVQNSLLILTNLFLIPAKSGKLSKNKPAKSGK